MALPGLDAAVLVTRFGYLGLGSLMAINCLGVPLPSEAALPLAGLAARTGELDLTLVIAIAVGAQLLGLMTSYFIGRHGGLAAIERYGRYVFIRHHHVRRAHKLFKQRGRRIVFIGLMMPGFHGYVGYPAGLVGMPFGTFTVLALAGTIVWTAVLVALGYVAGSHFEAITRMGHTAGLILAALLGVALIWYIRRTHRRSS